MDETPVYFDMVPSKTVNKKGAKTMKVRTTGSEKKRITAVPACTASGEMLKSMLIFKGKTGRSIKGVTSERAVITFQKDSWIDDQLMLKWIREVWVKDTKKQPSLLVLHSCSAHLTERVIDAFSQANTTTAVIPGGCTSVLQPLDVSINKLVKSLMKASWQDYMLERISSLGPGTKIAPPSKQLLTDWLVEANTKLNDNSTIVKTSFLVTGISNALGGHDNVLIRNDTTLKEINEVITEVIGEEVMGFDDSQPDQDLFDSKSSDSEQDNELEDDDACIADLQSDEADPSLDVQSDCESVSAPEY